MGVQVAWERVLGVLSECLVLAGHTECWWQGMGSIQPVGARELQGTPRGKRVGKQGHCKAGCDKAASTLR